MLDVSVPEVAPARLAHLLESIAEGWASGKIPPETYVRPYMNSIYLLNRRNARVIDLDGVQCLVWHRAGETMLHLEVRLRNPWFPAWHWPGPALEWRLSHAKSHDRLDARIIEQARECLPAVESVRELAKTALSECEGRTRVFCQGDTEPDWGMWAEQYILANALLGAKFTPVTASNMETRIRACKEFSGCVCCSGGHDCYRGGMDASTASGQVWGAVAASGRTGPASGVGR